MPLLKANRWTGKGFKIGLNLKVPNVNAKLTAIACKSCTTPPSHCLALVNANYTVAPSGACSGSGTTLGVKVGTNIGGALNLKASKVDGSDPLFTLQLAVCYQQFPGAFHENADADCVMY